MLHRTHYKPSLLFLISLVTSSLIATEDLEEELPVLLEEEVKEVEDSIPSWIPKKNSADLINIYEPQESWLLDSYMIQHKMVLKTKKLLVGGGKVFLGNPYWDLKKLLLNQTNLFYVALNMRTYEDNKERRQTIVGLKWFQIDIPELNTALFLSCFLERRFFVMSRFYLGWTIMLGPVLHTPNPLLQEEGLKGWEKTKVTIKKTSIQVLQQCKDGIANLWTKFYRIFYKKDSQNINFDPGMIDASKKIIEVPIVTQRYTSIGLLPGISVGMKLTDYLNISGIIGVWLKAKNTSFEFYGYTVPSFNAYPWFTISLELMI